MHRSFALISSPAAMSGLRLDGISSDPDSAGARSLFAGVLSPQLVPRVAGFDKLESDRALSGVAPDGFDDRRRVHACHHDFQDAAGIEFSQCVEAKSRGADLFDGDVVGKRVHVRSVTLDPRLE